MSTIIDRERVIESLRTARRELQDIGGLRHLSVSSGAFSALVDLEKFLGAVPPGVGASNDPVDRERAAAAVRIIQRELDDIARLFNLSFDQAFSTALTDLARCVDTSPELVIGGIGTGHSKLVIRDVQKPGAE